MKNRIVSLKNYTVRYLVISFLAILSLWALLFYAFILDEVYDNVDDGLKNQKIEILRALYLQPSLLETADFGISQFRVYPIAVEDFQEHNVLSNVLSYMPYDGEMEPYRLLSVSFHAKDGRAYQLEIRTSTVEEGDLLEDLAIALAVLFMLLVLSVFVVNRAVLARAWKPFDIILQHLRQYKLGHSETMPVVDTHVLEFQELNRELSDMVRRNEQVFQDQKRFIENASHELQTPLAITIHKMDVLLEDERLSEEQYLQIVASKKALLRLVHLNKSLLMLSKIENMQFKELEEVDFSTLTHELLDDFDDIIRFHGLEVEVLNEGHYSMAINPDLARILVSNLLRNAIRYAAADSKITIWIADQSWQIANTAVGDALDAQLIFKRFYKSNADMQASGLGLALVKSIVDSYKNLNINYHYEEKKHFFTISTSYS